MSDTTTEAADDLQRAFLAAQQVLIGLAKRDVNEFCAYVMRDEQTHGPIEQGPTHRQMQALCDKHDRLILWSYTGAGKTQQIAIARTLWVLRENPRARVIIVSNTKDMAAKIVRAVANYIVNSAEFRNVAVDVRQGEPWTSTSLYLRQEDGGFAKDPSVQACGVHGNLTGSRCEVMIWDDILDPEIVRTQASRDDLHAWLKSAAVLGRVDPHIGKVWCIGNAYHPDDSLHRFVEEGWHFARLPVVDERGRSTWPERWPLRVIEAKRKELGPLEFARQMLCRARDDSEARFKRDDLLACAARGRGLTWVRSAEELCGTPWPLPPGALDYMPPAPADAPSRNDALAAVMADAAAQAAHDATGPAGQRAQTAPPHASTGQHNAAASTLRPYTPPPRAAADGSAWGLTHGQGQAAPTPASESLVDRQDALFPDSAAISARKKQPIALETLPTDPDAPLWLRNRQEEARKTYEIGIVRGVRRGAEGLHPRAVRPIAVEDRAQMTPSALTNRAHDAHGHGAARPPGPEVASPPGHPSHPATQANGDAAQRGHVAAQPASQAAAHGHAPAPALPDLMDGAREGDARPAEPVAHADRTERIGAALAGETRGSAVAAMAAGELKVDEAAEALQVMTAAQRLGASVGDLRGAKNASLPPGPTDPTPGELEGGGVGENTGLAAARKNSELQGGVHASFVSRRVRTTDELVRYGGLDFPADAGDWLDAWATSPGTPHRRTTDLYPMHPRSVVGLRRMGVQFHTGVDLAVQRHSAADWTVLYTIAVYPPHGPDGTRTRRALEIDRGKYGPMEIIRRILSVRRRFGGKVLVENNAAQQYIIDLIREGGFLNGSEDPLATWLRGFTTGRNKASPEFGVESLAAEFAREDWIWPVEDEWHPNGATPADLERNWNEILYYDPREHTGDTLMAQWFARESARMDEPKRQKKAGTVGVRVL